MTDAPPHLDLIVTDGPRGYALLDTGHGRKLERFGTVIVDRPEPQAMWRPALPRGEWARANAVFSASGEDEEKGRWRIDRPVPDTWSMTVEGATMKLRLAGLWHLGLFPEQLPHWQWLLAKIAGVRAAELQGRASTQPGAGPAQSPVASGAEKFRVLNLFGYTGAASLVAARVGAEVVHVDASKKAVAWARENAQASGLANAPIRWICEDARSFVAREVRRGRTYHAILLDPPKFGRGPDGEVWELFDHLPKLLADCARLLAPANAHLVLTAYAIRASALALDGLMREALAHRPGTMISGELALAEAADRRLLLGTSLYSRWSIG